jgi:hypothetical protein
MQNSSKSRPYDPKLHRRDEPLAFQRNEQRQRKQVFKVVGLPGQKRQRAGGPDPDSGWGSLDGDAPVIADFSTGRKPKFKIEGPKKIYNIQQERLTSVAESLLEDYLRRRAFWADIKDGVEAERSGRLHLGIKKGRASAVYKELSRSGGALGWFRDRYFREVESGRIQRGCETKKTAAADAFFSMLAGGAMVMTDIQASIESAGMISCSEDARFTLEFVGTARFEHPEIMQEVCGYIVFGASR